MSIATRLKDFLDGQKVTYHVLKHHAQFTAQEIAGELHVPGQELAKVVMVKADGKFLMAVLPAPYRVNLTQLAAVAGVQKAELAAEDEFKGFFPDCDVGAMPPFGNLYNLEVYADRALTKDKQIVFEAGSHHEAIKLSYADFERLVKPKVADFTSR